MKKQTAVEWYYQQTIVEAKTNYAELLEQAKAMEKEQIIKADLAGVERTLLKVNEYLPVQNTLKTVRNIKKGKDTHDEGEQYYNETYGKDITATTD